MKFNCKLVQPILLTALLVVFGLNTAFAQTEVNGTVTDDSNKPLSGVSVLIKGTTNGTSTDAQGRFSIHVPGNATLLFSMVGFTAQEVAVKSQTVINLQLQAVNGSLGEVVVVGYGKKRRADISGAVSSVSNKELMQSPVSNVSNALVGRMAGLTVTNPNGRPGSGSAITIRGISTFGNNAVLTVVDGIIRDFQQIDPNEIESISILKDASAAAVYGSRAANGVILVTTKRGSRGKPTFQYNGYVGTQQPTLYPRLMTGYEYALTKNAARKNAGATPTFSDQALEDLKNRKVGTDWYDLTFKENAIQSQHNISVSGGSDALLYFMSLGYNDQDGMYDNINYKRLRLRSNVDAKISKYLTISTDIDAGLQKSNESSFSAESIFAHVIRQRPFVNAYNPDGSVAYTSGEHPAEEIKAGYNKGNNNVLQANLSMKYDVPFLKGLSALAKVGVGRNNTKQKIYFTPVVMYAQDANGVVTNTIPFGGVNGKIGLQELFNEYNTTLVNVSLNYDKNFLKHHITALALYEQFSATADNFYGFRTNFPASGLEELSWGGDAEKDASGGSFEDARKSYVGRLNYAYANKYLIELVARRDGSTAFPKTKKYGFFPAGSVAWRLSEEDFFKNSNALKFINNAKLRASYGLLGNDRNVYNSNNSPTFQYIQSYNLGATVISGGQALSSLVPGVLPNPDVSWETAAVTDIGLELGLWNNKLTIEADYFYKHTYDILLSRIRSVPGTLGSTLPKENYAVVDNKGIELTVGHQNRVGKVSYFVKGNIGFAKNKVITLDEPANIPDYLRQTGKPLGFITGYKSLGFFYSDEDVTKHPVQFNGGQKAGDVIYADINEDGKVDANDVTVISEDNTTPRIMYGLSLGVEFKGFDLSILFQGATRAKMVLEGTGRNFFNNGGSSNNFAYMLDYWTPENRDAAFPRPWSDAQPNNSQTSDLYLRNIAYIRLKSFDIGYTVPSSILQKAGINKLRIYCSGFNVFTWSKMKFFDPEISSTGGAYYPQQRNINVGVNLNF